MSSEGALPPRSDLGLIETLGWSAEAGLARLDRHLDRLSRSAGALGLPCDREAARAGLARAVEGLGYSPARVRLTLDAQGRIEVTAAPFTPVAPGDVWRVAIAGRRLDSGAPLLRHKTTRRAFYDEARAEAARTLDAEEVVFLNERGEVCEGSITNVFVEREGGLLTPPLASGLLPGCLRAELLEDGRAREAPIRPEALESPARWYLGNSLRGLVRARLIAPAR